ncbi:jg27748, partial [Pararge aegeria aegeria]
MICDKIETKDVYVDFCAILISHLKEYKKAIKRQETTPDSTVQSLYKKIHPISDDFKSNISADHCVNLLHIVLKELVPWELWDTPYSELLVRILAKKLNIFIENTISNPIWLNDKLLTILNIQEEVADENKKEKNSVNEKDTEKRGNDKSCKTEHEDGNQKEIGNTSSEFEKDIDNTNKKVTTQINTEPTIKPVKLTTNVQHKATESPLHMQKIVEEKEDKKQDDDDAPQGTEPMEIKPVLRKNRGRQGRNEVKIYDRIIE